MTLSELWQPLRRLLAHHLSRLRDNIEVMGERVREALASTVGKTVADAVRDVVERLLAVPDAAQDYNGCRYHDPWDDEREEWEDDDEPWHRDQHGGGVSYGTYEQPRPSENNVAQNRWQRALAIGLQAASWLLRRQLTTVPLASAFGLGLFATAASIARGPTVITVGAGIVAALLGLLNLVEAATATVDLAS